MEERERRHNDIIIIEKLSIIGTTLEFVKQCVENHSKDIDEIKEKLTAPNFQRLRGIANRIGDLEKTINMLSRDYNGISGFELLEILFNRDSKIIKLKEEMKNSFWKSIGHSFGSICVKSFPIVLMVCFIVVALMYIVFNDNITELIEIIKIIKKIK